MTQQKGNWWKPVALLMLVIAIGMDQIGSPFEGRKAWSEAP